MTEHPRETTLELYVLGSGTLNEADRDSIQRHLDRCAGCRSLAERMADFYDELHVELSNLDDTLPVLTPDDLPTKINQTIRPGNKGRFVISEVDPRLPFRMARWVVRHPVVSSAGAFAGLTIAAVLFLFFIPKREPLPRDVNPVELRMQGLMLRAINRYDEQVAEFEVNRELGDSYRNDPGKFDQLTGLADFDGDGNAEILWVERWAGEEKVTQRIHCVALNPVRTLWTHEVRRKLDYLHKPGANLIAYAVSQIRAGDFDRDGRPEVYAVLTSGLFSNQLLKLNGADGTEAGCYVHTGGLAMIEFFDVDGDSVPEILLGGTNNSWSEATIAILDPRHVEGQSVHTEPYALRHSVPANEKGYIRIPRTMLGFVNPRNVRNIANEIIPNPQNSVVRVGIKDDSEQRNSFISYYLTFGPDLSVLDADRGDGYMLVADSLYRAGKLPRPADLDYLREHIKKISWWDGEKWVHTPTWNRNGRRSNPPS